MSYIIDRIQTDNGKTSFWNPQTDPNLITSGNYYAPGFFILLNDYTGVIDGLTNPTKGTFIYFNTLNNKWEKLRSSNELDAVDTIAELTTTYPDARLGNWCFVRETNTVFYFDGSVWVNTGTGTTPDVLTQADVKDVLDSTSTNTPLSANQGRVLNERLQLIEAGFTFRGEWNASTNTPTLPSTPDSNYKIGDFFDVTVAGTQFGIDFTVRDKLVVSKNTSQVKIWVKRDFGQIASDISYDNATSGLVATNVQTAINELDVNIDNIKAEQIIQNSNGFVSKTNSTLALSTRTFTISPNTSYDIFVEGKKYTITTNYSVTIPNTVGLHYIYFNIISETLTLSSSLSQDKKLFTNWGYVANIYWNGTSAILGVQDERHGVSMSGDSHYYLHTHNGTIFKNGLIVGVNVDGDGSNDNQAQFSITSGLIADEDNEFNISSKILSDNVPILYRLGTAWQEDSINFIVKTGINGRAVYNQNVVGSYQLTQIANNDFGICFVVCGTSYDATKRTFVVIGNESYATLGSARDGASQVPDLSGLPFQEFKIIAGIIFQTSDSYINTVKTRIRSIDVNNDYVDWRYLSINGTGASGSDIADLQTQIETEIANRQSADIILQDNIDLKANDNAVVHLTGDETIAGIKTFSSFSITPSSAPATDYQVANKKYVDDASPTQLNSSIRYVSKAGNDSFNGQVNRKKLTIAGALSTVENQSANIYIESGNYNEIITLGTSHDRINLIGEEGGRTVLKQVLFTENNTQSALTNIKLENAGTGPTDFAINISSTLGGHVFTGLSCGGNHVNSIFLNVEAGGSGYITIANCDLSNKIINLANTATPRFCYINNCANIIINAGTGWIVVVDYNSANIIEISSNSNILKGIIGNGIISNSTEYNFVVSLGAAGNGFYFANYTQAGVFSTGDIILRQNPATIVYNKHYNTPISSYFLISTGETIHKSGGIWKVTAGTTDIPTITASNGLQKVSNDIQGINATTSAKGVTQLSNTYNGTSQTLATTEKALSDGLALKEALANKNQPSGYVGLDANSKINIDYIPESAISKRITVADEAARFALTTNEVQNGDHVYQNDTEVLYYVIDDTNLDNASGYDVIKQPVDWSSIQSKPTTIAGYGITDAYTQDETDTLLDDKENTSNKGIADGYVGFNASQGILIDDGIRKNTVYKDPLQVNANVENYLPKTNGYIINDADLTTALSSYYTKTASDARFQDLIAPVADEAAMLALTGIKVGYVVKRTDLSNVLFQLVALPASTLGNWQQIGGGGSGGGGAWGDITGTLSDQTDLQNALNAKQATITGAATTALGSDFGFNNVVITSATGKLDYSSITTTELGRLNGVTSSIQTQLDSKEGNITNLPVSKGGVGINDLSGNALQSMRVNSAANGYEFFTPTTAAISVKTIITHQTVTGAYTWANFILGGIRFRIYQAGSGVGNDIYIYFEDPDNNNAPQQHHITGWRAYYYPSAWNYNTFSTADSRVNNTLVGLYYTSWKAMASAANLTIFTASGTVNPNTFGNVFKINISQNTSNNLFTSVVISLIGA